MKIIDTKLPGLVIIEPDVYGDDRGFFMETWHKKKYAEAGITGTFVQDNLSFSKKDTLRGIHFQYPDSQGKLVYVLQGEVYDVAVDIRLNSPTFGQWAEVMLSGDNKRQLYIPEGFAHGFCVVSETALFAYKCTSFYNQQSERGIAWNDPDLNINWPCSAPLLSDKDRQYPMLRDYPESKLPRYEGKS